MKVIRQSYRIHAPLENVWQALVNPRHIEAWGGGPAIMDEKTGTKFSLWGGSVWGVNKEVILHKKLVQEWYSEEEKKWEQPSLVTFTFHREKNDVRVDLVHKNVPDIDIKNIDQGWKDYYMNPLKKYLESK